MKLVHLFAVLCLTVGVESTYVDTQGASIDEIAELVCKNAKGTKDLIGQLSTIHKLVDYLSATTSENKQLFECRAKYLESLEELVQVINAAADDICGDEKLNLIENFHRKYVSKRSKDLKKHKRSNKAPKMAKLFFMQYATRVSTVCEQGAIEFVKNNKHAYGPEEMRQIDGMKKFTDSLGMTDLHKGYKSVYLFWNMVELLELAEREKFSEYLEREGDVRLNIQMKSAKAIRALQLLCRYQLKPLYAKSMLPVLRLVDLGYYPSDSPFVEELNSNPAAQSLFYSTQICETILPVAVFGDEQLSYEEIVAVTKQEAAKLVPPKLEVPDELINQGPSVEVVPKSIGDELTFGGDVTSIKANVDNRNKIVNFMLKKLMKHTKAKLKSLFKGFKLSRKEDSEREPIDDKQLEQMSAEQSLQILEDHEDNQTRRKRGLTSLLKSAFSYALYIIIGTIYIAFVVLSCIMPAIILGPAVLLGSETAAGWLRDFWNFDSLDYFRFMIL